MLAYEGLGRKQEVEDDNRHGASKLVPDMKIVVDGEVHEANWRAFKKEYKFTSASMAALLREAGEDFLNAKKVKGGRNRVLPENAPESFQ